ncbi:MAG: aminotransferase class IV [Flavobacteriaceae bacterium]|nr:aminotransferase class IV [Flavobacteriaceae bacterium]
MINFNGEIISKNEFHLSSQNRAFKYGDAIFDTLKFSQDKIYFIEDHYFRLMSSMRMLRMTIPMNFTLKYYEDEILKTIENNVFNDEIRIRVSVFRKEGGLYKPKSLEVDFFIEINPINKVVSTAYEIELFKDFSIYSGLLSTIKTNNRMVNILSSIYASENNYNNCVLINERKNIVEANNANIFLIKENQIITPALTEGCINGIIRNKIIELMANNNDYKLVEASISPFELLKADEVFLTNSIFEIKSVTKYRKKTFLTVKTEEVRKLFIEKYLN